MWLWPVWAAFGGWNWSNVVVIIMCRIVYCKVSSYWLHQILRGVFLKWGSGVALKSIFCWFYKIIGFCLNFMFLKGEVHFFLTFFIQNVIFFSANAIVFFYLWCIKWTPLQILKCSTFIYDYHWRLWKVLLILIAWHEQFWQNNSFQK